MEKIILNNKHLNTLDKNKPIILAVSGGVDSMVLFSLLKNCGYKIIIAHINHHKRAESDVEEKYILSLASDDVVVEVYNYYYEKENFQADAHNKRYAFFYRLYKKYNASAIITAHHYIDNLETILMNIVRGSNLYGYAGIKEISYYEDALLIRPLINCDKKDIYNYANKNNITYFEDSSNNEDTYLRNRIRHHIIDKLQLENPSLGASISNYSNQLFDAFNYIRSSSVNYLEENNYKIEISTFNNLALILKKDIINYICDNLGIISSENKINDILSLIENPKPNLSYSLNDKYQFIKEYNTCYVSKINKTESIKVIINLEEEKIIDEYGLFKLTSENILNGTETLKLSRSEPLPLTIRNRIAGDKLIIGQGHKKLKDFLIDKKVPKNERDKLIVVTNNENEIIWVMGYYKKACTEKNNLNLIFMEK